MKLLIQSHLAALPGLLGVLLICCAPHIRAQANPSAADKKNAEENAAFRKEWESWNAPFKPFASSEISITSARRCQFVFNHNAGRSHLPHLHQ